MAHHVTRFATLFVLASSALGAPPARAENWELRRHDVEHDVVVYDREIDAGYREFRGITHVHSRLSAFVALFRDTEHMPGWLYRAKRVETLWASDTQSKAYTVIGMPWPFRDRDAVIDVVLSQDPITQALTLRAKAVPDSRPEVDGYIRMPIIESTWRFTPLPDGRTEVEFSGYADPGGRLSTGLLKIFQSKLVWQSPYRTLQNLHDVIDAPRYQTARYGYVREPSIWSAESAERGP